MSLKTHADLRRHLTEGGVRFRELTHAPVASARQYQQVVGSRLEQQAKCLFLRLENDLEITYAIYALPASCRGDLQKAARALAVRNARLASAEELAAVTGCRFGELPPTGKLFGVALLMDPRLLGEEEIYFNAGRLDTSFVVKPHDLAAIESPIMLPGLPEVGP